MKKAIGQRSTLFAAIDSLVAIKRVERIGKQFRIVTAQEQREPTAEEQELQAEEQAAREFHAALADDSDDSDDSDSDDSDAADR